MSEIRLACVAILLTAVFYVGGLVRPLTWGEVALAMFAVAVIYEIGVHKLQLKISRWPKDVANAEKIINILMGRNGKDEIMAIHFGRVSDELLGRLRFARSPGMKESMFHDKSLEHSYQYLREQIGNLLATINSEMFASDTDFQGVELPREWKVKYKSDLYDRYRSAQRNLLAQSKSTIAGIEAFANCLKGASHRI